MEFLQSLLDITAVCQKCKYGKLQVKEEKEKKMGLASLIVAECQQCLKRVEMYTSPNCKNSKGFEINRRAVLGAMEIGGGETSLLKLCAYLNIPSPMSHDTYSSTMKTIQGCLKNKVAENMRDAAKEEKDQETNHTECDVMLDGTWRKRGFSSLQGAVTAISAKTGKCLDFETLNKVCHGCSTWKSKPDCPEKEKWLAEHNCATNYHGSAPAMEPEGVKRIFLRSEELHQLQYTGYIGDGDSKAYNNVSSLKPYGEKTIKKHECVGHVQKRLGTALRKVKTKYAGQKLSDGKSIGGFGRLTADRIDRLQTYYGLAIRRHKNDLEGMKKEVWAGLHHSASTNDEPQHQYCPEGPETWCKFNKAALKSEPYHHSKPLPKAVMEVLKPIYERLSKDSILEGCLGGYTQNSCESLNHLIWARCPKTMASGKVHLDCAAAAAVIVFNSGNMAMCGVLEELGVEPGRHTAHILQELDRKRIKESNASATEKNKKIRKTRRTHGKAADDRMQQTEGLTYASGSF